ncbi:MAG TPA: C25 family cysteine peptidase [Candidatus Krumholzibacteria bacterium]|nr:C25 family cysteine peptidase [Candidatus Krumholzibacteria bacterium]HPD70442.1 C25 family cysteine peptidase [Candidatus Krumholzibacteria bacterium]HRY39858.1 C25 family cysteine peptidase [Candidatus Krumholzibacteria bacterium]
MRSHLAATLALVVLGGLAAAAYAYVADPAPQVIPVATGATSAGAEVRLVERTASGMVLEFELAGIERESVTVGARRFDQLDIPGGGFRGAEGQPALPTVTRLVAVPDGVAVSAQVTGREVRSLGRLDLAPVLPVQESGKAAPGFDAASYARAPRSETTVTVGEPALLHGLRVVPVTFTPVGYDPATGETTVASRMVASLAFAGRDDRAPTPAARRLIPESFATVYERMVIGWERGGTVQAGPGTVIYVCPNNSTVVGIIEPLAEWRREQGYAVEVVTTATAGTTAAAIRTWLQGRYATCDPPLEFVVLVGDANGTVAIPTFNENQSGYYGEGDHDYSRLDGTDVLPDVHVGRLSVQSTSQLQLAVDKIVGYESAPDFGDTGWFTTAGLTGDPADSGNSCIFTNQFVKQELLRLGYTRVDTIWSGNFVTQMLATINQGETLFTYRGLMYMSGLGSSHILATSNGRQLPFAIILTCDTGSFQDDTTARSEAWLRAANGGGIGAVGTATTGTHTRYNNCMFLGITDHLLAGEDFRLGPALTGGKLNFYVNYWQAEPVRVWSWLTWNNLMGDPVTEMWTGVPQALAVVHPAALASTATALPVTVTAAGAPVAGARVAAYQAGTVRSWALTDATGHAVLDLAGVAAGDLHVTVTGHDLYPYRAVATIGTVASSLDLIDLSLSDVVGNGDGVANPGESLQVGAALVNGGTNAAAGVMATLVDGPAWATYSPGGVAYGTVAAGATVWGGSPFVIQLDPDAPGGEDAVFELVATSGANSWTSRLVLPISGPQASIQSTVWGLPGSSPDPGESGALSVVLLNVGDLATGGITGTLSTESRWVTVTDAAGAWGPTSAGASATQLDPFAIAIDATCYPGQTARFVLALDFAERGKQTVEFTVTIGTAVAGDPTGPDAYGYWAFSDDDDGPDAPDYAWVELAGLGADTGIRDLARGDDETRVVELPFEFVYYGQVYGTISVCSNGWLAFGRSGLVLYRGWYLPADGSPDAMVCAFWDDLANGTVYTWHDEANHRFIVQWDNFRTWNSGQYYTGNCTFEIILTDPAYSGTDTGDGLITVQYQSVTVSGDETSYFTVGIQDQTRTIGLNYVYGNRYASGAAVVAANRAITFRPILAENPDTVDVPPTAALDLAQNHPNPFNPRTTITFTLPRAQHVSLRVYDLQGRCRGTLADGERGAGVHQLAWQGTDDDGLAVPSGTYVYRLVTEDGSLVRKMLLLR